MKQETKPLYKALNSERTQGNWQMSADKCDVETADDARLGIFRMFATEADEANAQYTALAVNNLHHLAEALQELHIACMMDSDIPVSWWKKHRETVAKAKEALNRIS